MKYVVRENTAMHAICDAKFTSRTSVYRAPFEGFLIHSYTAHTATLYDVVRRFEPRASILHLGIRVTLATFGPLTGETIASIDYRASCS